jgi:predicted negative regulator of RcsB-dependent stress response
MSEESSFSLKHASEAAYVEPSGVLDQLNLPPSVVKFLRENKRLLQVLGVVTVVLVVSISLYQSYHQSRLENAASSLAISMEAEGVEKVKALEHVASEFDGTPSAMWASVELGHIAMQAGEYDKAATLYSQVKNNISTSNPMLGLLIYGLAQAQEAGKKYAEASSSYADLKTVAGYQDEGYLGMARVFEAKGDNEKAIGVYEEYLGTFLGKDSNERAKLMIQDKITRLRAQQ